MKKPDTQSGSVLIISLVILLVMTMLGMGGMHTAMMQERMLANRQMMQVAFQAAEAGLRDGEKDVVNNITQLTPFNEDCTNGLCEASGSGLAVWHDVSKVDWQALMNTIAYGQNTGENALQHLTTQPRYIIERLPATGWYRITAMGYAGQNNQVQMMLQSVYCKISPEASVPTGRQSWRQIK